MPIVCSSPCSIETLHPFRGSNSIDCHRSSASIDWSSPDQWDVSSAHLGWVEDVHASVLQFSFVGFSSTVELCLLEIDLRLHRNQSRRWSIDFILDQIPPCIQSTFWLSAWESDHVNFTLCQWTDLVPRVNRTLDSSLESQWWDTRSSHSERERRCFSLVDPIENKTSHSVIKFFEDLFGEQGTLSDILLSDADGRLIIEIISRELSNRSCVDQVSVFFFNRSVKLRWI